MAHALQSKQRLLRPGISYWETVQSRVRLTVVSVCMFYWLSSPAVLLHAQFSGICVFWYIIYLPCRADQLGSPLKHSANPLRRAGAPHSTASSPSCFPEQWLLPHNLLPAQVPGERTTSLLTNIDSTPDLVSHPSAPISSGC